MYNRKSSVAKQLLASAVTDIKKLLSITNINTFIYQNIIVHRRAGPQV